MALQLKKSSNSREFLTYPLKKIEIERYYENEPRFIGVYSRDNLPKAIKNGAYKINLDEYADVGMHWIIVYIKNNGVICFDSFGVEHVSKEVVHFIGQKDIKTNIFRIQADNSIICGYCCIAFIDFMFAGGSVFGFASLLAPYYFKKMIK